MNCYVLVGGRSTRMGTSKAELFFGRILATASPLFEEVVAVDRPAGTFLPAAARVLHEQPHQEEAPIFGVEAALADAAPRSCFILAVDYPFVSTAFLRWMVERAESSEAEITVPWWDGYPQSLCAVWRSTLLPVVRGAIARARLDLRGVVSRAAAERIEEREIRERFAGELLRNVNRPEDLAVQE